MSPILARQRALWLSTPGAILMCIGLNLKHETWMLILALLGLVAVLAGAVLMFRFWRCPHCKERLPQKNVYAGVFVHCPYCGQPLE